MKNAVATMNIGDGMTMARNVLVSFMSILMLSGCDSGPTIVPASGTLKVSGKPLGGISLTFMPDVTKGNAGPTSYASTEDDGSFTLMTQTGQAGAVVGPHVVTLADEREERAAQGAAPAKPARIDSSYSMTSNGLKVTVAEGQPIELTVR